MSNAVPRVFINPLWSLGRIVSRTSRAFSESGDIIELIGLPKKVFCFGHPDTAQEILTHPVIGGTKYLQMIPKVKSILRSGAYVLQGGEDWKQRRRLVQPAFTAESIAHYMGGVVDAVQKRTDRWRSSGGDSHFLDIHEEMRELTVDITFKVFLSTDLGSQVAHVTRITRLIEENFINITPSWLPTPKNIKYRQAESQLRSIIGEIVRQRRVSGEKRTDLISLLLGSWGVGPVAVNDDAIVDELLSIYFGFSVMGVTVTWLLYLLATHPDSKKQVQDEGIAFLNAGTQTRIGRSLGLKHTQMVFWEAARLFPPSWGIPRHATESVLIGGETFSADSILIPMVYHIQRDARFWSDPEIFDPNRFSTERTRTLHPFAHFPFGGGMRKCTGANLAPILIQLIAVTVLARFDLEFFPRHANDPTPNFAFDITPKNGMIMKIRPLG